MAGKTITSADAIFMLSVPDLFGSPIQLQGFSAENIFATEAQQSAEVVMGVDGFMTAGFVFVPAVQNIELLADSESNAVFDQWNAQQKLGKTIYYADGIITLPAIRVTYSLTRGVLSSFPPIADAAKTLRPRRYGVTWATISAGPLAV